MTKLWEDTVVISLRDAQWLHCKDQRPKAVAPPSFLKMDGNAESSLGDVLFSSSAKFYLIEVKGTASDIASEWTGGASGDQKKRLYRALAHRWNQLEDAASREDDEEIKRLLNFFAASLSCHLFSYWEEWLLNDVKVGDVVVIPYLTGCIREYVKKDGQEGEFISNLFENSFLLGVERSGRSFVSEVASVDLLFKRNGRVFTTTKGSERVLLDWSLPLGLSLAELQAYVDALTEDEPDVPDMHRILMDTSGQVFKSYASMADLKLALDPYAQTNSVLKSNSLRMRSLRATSNPAAGYRP
ncbi:hypothetical protein [Xanthomonas campestris]|uniref:hypothetical protein n=1 Tax=Xanthomonas campestris TaxID=339 RepID=UPI002379D8F5|nr:hypothetical protein [Xanthomonas campestris]WDK02005.1 hypothetical protein JH273_19995 [Xanthomonas campestris]